MVDESMADALISPAVQLQANTVIGGAICRVRCRFRLKPMLVLFVCDAALTPTHWPRFAIKQSIPTTTTKSASSNHAFDTAHSTRRA